MLKVDYESQLMAGVGYSDGYCAVYVPPRNFHRWPFKLQRAYLMAWYYGRGAQMMRQQKKTLEKWREILCISSR